MGSKAHPPELKKYMDKRVVTKLNGGRLVEGSLRGFDPFLNLVVDDGVEVKKNGERVRIGVVASVYRKFWPPVSLIERSLLS